MITGVSEPFLVYCTVKPRFRAVKSIRDYGSSVAGFTKEVDRGSDVTWVGMLVFSSDRVQPVSHDSLISFLSGGHQTSACTTGAV